MQSEWPLVPVADCCDLIVDCVNKTAPVVDVETPYRMIRTTNVRNGFIDLADCKFVDEATFRTWTRRAAVLDGDIVLTREAPIGEVGLVRGNRTIFLGQRLMQYRANKALLDPRFLCYAFLSPQLQHQFGAHEGSGSVVSHIRVGDCLKFKIPLPPISEQQAIADLLGSIDERVLLLRQTNATLESIAQALFQSWFISFDPVRAKAEGREPEGMDAATAALFPAEFEESALGLIPRGWRASKAGDVFRITMGQSPPGDTYNQEGAGVPFYQGRADFGFRFPTVRVHCTAPTRRAREGDVLVSVRAPVGDVNVALEPCAVGRGVAAVGLDDAPSFALYSMKALRERFAEYESHGTVFGSINKKQFEALPCVIPSPEVLAAFSCTVGTFDERVRVNELQVRSLKELRDSLLPRLISGKLRLPETHAQLEEVIA